MRRAIEASRRQVEAAEIAYEGAKEELAVGVRTTLDVLDQEQQLFEARLSLVGAERDAYRVRTMSGRCVQRRADSAAWNSSHGMNANRARLTFCNLPS